MDILILNFSKNLVIIDQSLKFGFQIELFKLTLFTALQFLLLVLLLDEFFEDLLKILYFAVFSVLQKIVNYGVLEGKHDLEHSLTRFFVQLLVMHIHEHVITSDKIDRILVTRRQCLGLTLLALK